MYVEKLAALLAKSRENKAKVCVGTYSNGSVCVNGQYYKPIWDGDFDVTNGARVDCVVEAEKCVVFRVS